MADRPIRTPRTRFQRRPAACGALVTLLALIACTLGGCITRVTAADAHGHAHAGNDHAGHDHVGHDHVGHDHAGHDHEHDHAHAPDHAPVHDRDHPQGLERADLRSQVTAPHAHEQRAPLRMNFACGWCDAYGHDHESVCGTPYVHAFLTEPAFLCTDLILGATRGADETEVEAELEWAFSRRVGLIAEMAWIDGEAQRGIGDAALAVRVLLIEERTFLLSLIGEVEIPTGSEARGLGEGHVACAANAVTWHDLGSWCTLQTRLGVEHVPDEGETELLWSASLIKSFRARPLIANCGCGVAEHRETVWSLHAEVAGATLLEGEEAAGETEGVWLLGATYPLAYDVDIRGAYTRTFGGDEDESAWTLGVVIHF